MTIETHPHSPKPGRTNTHEGSPMSKHGELKRALEMTSPSRATRYVYHVHGHAKLHDPHAKVPDNMPPNGPVVPFEVVIRRPFAIDSDEVMDEVREEVRHHILGEMKRQGSPYIVGDVMIRGVSKLHRILVEANDPAGAAVRIMS